MGRWRRPESLDVRGQPKPPSLRHHFVVDITRGVLRVRKWPKPPGKTRDPINDVWWQRLYALLQLYKVTHPRMLEDIKQALRHVQMYPRDYFVAAVTGNIYLLETEDGHTIYPLQAMIKVSQALDSIGQVRGDLLVRGEDWWIRLPLGSAGQVLMVDADTALPAWKDPPQAAAGQGPVVIPAGAMGPAGGSPSLTNVLAGWSAWTLRDSAADAVHALLHISQAQAPYTITALMFVTTSGTHQFRITFRYQALQSGSTITTFTDVSQTITLQGGPLHEVTLLTDYTPPDGAYILNAVVRRDGTHADDTSTAGLRLAGLRLVPNG
jgi:hypothetical protein